MAYNYETTKKEFDSCKSFFDTLYNQAIEDWKFLHGINQWDDRRRAQREKNGQPCLVLNNLLPYQNQIVNDARQANMAIRCSPVDDESDIEKAEVLQDIVRNIEYQSRASSAYITALKNSTGAGIGWIKIRVDYSDPLSFEQEVYIDRVLDFSSVYLDPNTQTLDGSDAEFCFIRVDYTKEEFERIYPDAQAISFEGQDSRDDNVCVVEYYKKHYKKTKIYKISIAGGVQKTITQEQKKILDDSGEVFYEVIEERETQGIPYIKHYVLNGEEDPIEETEFPSQFIPIVPVYGNEVYLDGRREFHSLIRQSKDSQKLFNYWKSSSAEFIALQPKAPTIGAVGSFDSQRERWDTANVNNYATLEYDVVFDENGQRVEPPQKQPPVTGSITMMQEAAHAREDIRLSLGMPQANMGEQGNEISGIAIRNRQIEGDNATFHYIDNLAFAISRVGQIVVDIIQRIYSDRTIARVRGVDGEERLIPLNIPYVKEGGFLRAARDGESADGIFDITTGKYDVVCDVGASYSSKRQESADWMIKLVQSRPEMMDVFGDLLFKSLDVPYSQDIADRMRAIMDPSILGEDPQASKLAAMSEAMKAMEQKLIDYQAMIESKQKDLAFEQEYKVKQLEIEREDLAIKASKTAAEIEKMRAETKGFNMEAVAALGNAVNSMHEQMADITDTIDILLSVGEHNLESPYPEKEGEMFEENEND